MFVGDAGDATDKLEKVIFMGSVDAYFKQFLKKNSSLLNKLQEASVGAATSAGVLQYGGLCFTEYKVGKETRFFANEHRGFLCVYLIATRHQGKTYYGITWDGEDEFAVRYLSDKPDPNAMADTAWNAARNASPHLTSAKNTMKAYNPTYTWD
jgi:hypothetical protein